ncbi:hypothetical protein LSH36_111g04012 [Paralvinella palmiformis]|uniref:Uncharacterized protein n=1 Tax=Paralvinella palmiformis TaxID=53620 RepID=A0AAD9JZQ3_9ANNE|nr:hypothetical protein LSH36_111g04012 [Paralvinella palmiformis]
MISKNLALNVCRVSYPGTERLTAVTRLSVGHYRLIGLVINSQVVYENNVPVITNITARCRQDHRCYLRSLRRRHSETVTETRRQRFKPIRAYHHDVCSLYGRGSGHSRHTGPIVSVALPPANSTGEGGRPVLVQRIRPVQSPDSFFDIDHVTICKQRRGFWVDCSAVARLRSVFCANITGYVHGNNGPSIRGKLTDMFTLYGNGSSSHSVDRHCRETPRRSSFGKPDFVIASYVFIL